jgi:hypothetical protein
LIEPVLSLFHSCIVVVGDLVGVHPVVAGCDHAMRVIDDAPPVLAGPDVGFLNPPGPLFAD